MYEVGKVYIWQNCGGEFSVLNGTETIVLPGLVETFSISSQSILIGQNTDTIWPDNWTGNVPATPGKLRPKNPPSGEQLIRTMFEPKPVMEPA